MTAVLLDTSVVLYLLKYPERLGELAIDQIKEADAFYVSAVSLWEIAIKMKAGKLKVVLPLETIPGLIGANQLAIQPSHSDAYLKIKLPHKDPFDTMLMAQVTAEGFPLITADKILLSSEYSTIDAKI